MAVVVERGEGVAAVEDSMRDDFIETVVNHGAAEDEAQEEGSPGLQVVQGFGHTGNAPIFEGIAGGRGRQIFYAEGVGVGKGPDGGFTLGIFGGQEMAIGG